MVIVMVFGELTVKENILEKKKKNFLQKDLKLPPGFYLVVFSLQGESSNNSSTLFVLELQV